jgi:hypothetical protein
MVDVNPCYSKIYNFHTINAKLLIAINHSNFSFFQNFKMGENHNFVGVILLVKSKCNKNHIYGLN